jgi:uncharacterized membrane protein YfcA
MSPTEEPRVADVLSALNEAASQVGSFVNHVIDEQPGVALASAMAAGFVAGGGLNSPLGSRLTASTLRATLVNLTTLVALDLLRRAVENGGGAGAGDAETEPAH